MWPDRRLQDLLGIEHPIVLSPMAGFATVELAVAVAAAGGLGSIGCATMTPQQICETADKLRTQSNRPMNFNFFCHREATPDPLRDEAWRARLAPYYRELGLAETQMPQPTLLPFGEAQCAAVEATRPAVASFHFGLPEPALLRRVKAAGCRVMASATTVAEARWLEDHGADVVIAQGNDAGGHRGMFLAEDFAQASASQPGTMALVPQVVDAVSVPVVAAGGIADGRGIAAAFALGAAGVQIGTAYLRCPEAATSPPHRAALRDTAAAATALTNVFTGRPARALVNRVIREVGPLSREAPRFPLAMAALAPLRAAAEAHGSTDFTALWAGQSAALGRELPAGQLTRTLVAETLERFRHLAG
jgi:nitronate monooxygenase